MQELQALYGMLAAAAIIAAIYFFPACVGFARRHHNRWPVLIVNLFFGWTLLGWVVALAMAAGEVRAARSAR